jgi:hypothetical protein
MTTIWTNGPAEYEHARKILLDAAAVGGGKVEIHLGSGDVKVGWITRTSSGTDVGEQLAAIGKPIVTKLYGEIHVQFDSGETIVLQAGDIEKFGVA